MARILLLAFRVAVFGLFILCNAVLCVVGILDLTIARSVHVNNQADTLAILIGVVGLLLMFPILLFEVLKRKAAWNRVWFETSWVAIFSTLYLIASIVLTLAMDTPMCTARVTNLVTDACTTTRAVVAFSWLGFIILFQYLLTLIACACLHQSDASSIWSVEVSRYPWFASRWLPERSYPSAPQPFFIGQRDPSPMPEKRRPVPSLINWRRGGLGSDYVVEPYRAPSSRKPSRDASRTSSLKSWRRNKRSQSPPKPSLDPYREIEVAISSRQPFVRPLPAMPALAPVESLSSGALSPRSFSEWPKLQVPQRTQARPQITISNHTSLGSFPLGHPRQPLPTAPVLGASPVSPVINVSSRRPLGPREPSAGPEDSLRVPAATWAPPKNLQPHRPPPLDLSSLLYRADPGQ